jgi:hypothetical protein
MRRLILPLALVFSLALSISVFSATPPTGTIKVATPGLHVFFSIDKKIVEVSAEKEAVVPVGTYTPVTMNYQVREASKDDKKGPLWTIMSFGSSSNLAKVQVKDSATATIEGGPPLTVKAIVGTVATEAKGVKTVPIDLAIEGKAGERYSAGTVTQDGKQVPAPTLKVVDESGKVLTSANFEYG